MKNKSKGLLIVVSGPSGVGKGTVVKELVKDENFVLSISATTREPRNEEKDGVAYHFMSRKQFEDLIFEDAFLEYACYCENYYGTPKAKVFEQLNNGKNVILEIEVQGYENIKKKYPECIGIFVMPPSFEILEQRLKDRGTESTEVIHKRLGRAFEEVSTACHYDYIVVNDRVDKCVSNVKSVVQAEKLRVSRYTV